MLTAVSLALGFLVTPCFAISNVQQIKSVSQELHSIQTKLTTANNKLEKICGCKLTIIKQTNQAHRTANGHR
ncbi:MAG: hypothetical protein RL755_199 [Pseudomonadota bacterium]|jgi:hypothetical protein